MDTSMFPEKNCWSHTKRHKPDFGDYQNADSCMASNSSPDSSQLICKAAQDIPNLSVEMENNEEGLKIVDSFSISNFDKQDDQGCDESQETANNIKKTVLKPTSYTLKKKKLEHFIDNLFKVANEKVVHPEDADENLINKPSIAETSLNSEHYDEEQSDIKVKLESKESRVDTNYGINSKQDSSFPLSLVSVEIKNDPDADINVDCKVEKDLEEDPLQVIKQEDNGKPTEKVFGWCSIEDLKKPPAASIMHMKNEMYIKQEFQLKKEPPHDLSEDYDIDLDPQVKQECIEEHEMKIELQASGDEQTQEELSLLKYEMTDEATVDELEKSHKAENLEYSCNEAGSKNIAPSSYETSKSSKSIAVSDLNTTNFTSECSKLSKQSSDVLHARCGGKRVRGQNFCLFCGKLSSNFARHIMNSHSVETEVQQILALPPKSTDRKNLIAAIRKRGNHILNLRSSCPKPVKKSNLKNTTLLPCPHCLGYYSKKNLWRHRFKCRQNCDKKHTTLADSQTLLINNKECDTQLKKKVFPHMKPDDISLTAKQDPLICAFGSRYLKTHKQKQSVNTTSQKMRELARVLVEVKKLKPDVENLFQALSSPNYDVLVQSTKAVIQYDEEKKTFKAPTLAMRIAKSFKDCCNIAINQILKKKFVHSSLFSSKTIEEFKNLIELIQSNWQTDFSGETLSDLTVKKKNKVTIIPLASDLKVFMDYLTCLSEEAAKNLLENPNDAKSYKRLLETVYCKVLTSNSQKPEDLQHLPLETFVNGRTNYEEFAETITPSEKILMKSFKHVIIKGYQGQEEPVFFSHDMIKHLNFLLEIRPKMFTTTENHFLFGLPELSIPLKGYTVLAKYAKASGAKKPAAITATQLRKYLATITKIQNMSQENMEQLIKFMGLTESTHHEEFRPTPT